ncbi:MAG: hypothetical protein HZA91_17475 [Verrucomicrobia bacterium]|nr:hypothetical protein [Verrucomicrobiota bacterium]
MRLLFCSLTAFMLLATAGCTEMKEGETDVPGRVTRGMQGGGHLGGSPSGVFEPR